MPRLQAPWIPHVPMKRIICHWTAGTNKANDVDRKAYHILIEGDGAVVRGIPTIDRNSGSIKDGYAAHTLNCNTDSIGVSLCGMAGAIETPFKPGPYPITKTQWAVLIEVVAELAAHYDIPVTPKTILFHAEVESNLGIKQRNKWDITRLPFDLSLITAAAVGNLMRSSVAEQLKSDDVVLEPVPVGAIAVTTSIVKTRSAKGGPDTGSIPANVKVEVTEVEGMLIRVETPAGYLVWADRTYFRMVDGPKVETNTQADSLRDVVTTLRTLADQVEASIA